MRCCVLRASISVVVMLRSKSNDFRSVRFTGIMDHRVIDFGDQLHHIPHIANSIINCCLSPHIHNPQRVSATHELSWLNCLSVESSVYLAVRRDAKATALLTTDGPMIKNTHKHIKVIISSLNMAATEKGLLRVLGTEAYTVLYSSTVGPMIL